ncbi:MAG: hypothetical protein KIT27_08030 [Legionellales bacterium]|nr:hypothetical protein [Legionellales bacterium]
MKKLTATIVLVLTINAAQAAFPPIYTYECDIHNQTQKTLSYHSAVKSGTVQPNSTAVLKWASVNSSKGMSMNVEGCNIRYEINGTASGDGVVCTVQGDNIIVNPTL